MSRLAAKTVLLGVGDGLALGDVADEPLARLGDRDHRRRRLTAPAFGMTAGSPPSTTATHELVVPRSMPMTLPISALFLRFGKPCVED